jgi:hypothetical protein
LFVDDVGSPMPSRCWPLAASQAQGGMDCALRGTNTKKLTVREKSLVRVQKRNKSSTSGRWYTNRTQCHLTPSARPILAILACVELRTADEEDHQPGVGFAGAGASQAGRWGADRRRAGHENLYCTVPARPKVSRSGQVRAGQGRARQSSGKPSVSAKQREKQ